MQRRRLLLCFAALLLLFCSVSPTSASIWTWIKGANTTSDPGEYGAFRAPSELNNPPARFRACSAFHSGRNETWMFGGRSQDNSGRRNDLWRYQVDQNVWTWMGGSSTTDATGSEIQPSSRDSSACMIDEVTNSFYIFGGRQSENQLLNDMWIYFMDNSSWAQKQIATSIVPVLETKYVGSKLSTPGARDSMATAYDPSQKTWWLFGGITNVTNSRNDLWAYYLVNDTFIWFGGGDAEPNYGTFREPSDTTQPGRRSAASAWFDTETKSFLLFGGAGDMPLGVLNDLWQFKTEGRQWAWISGNNTVDQFGTYGNLSEYSPSSTPGGRFLAASAFDPRGRRLILACGKGQTYDQPNTNLQDIFSFSLDKQQWAWEGGSNRSISASYGQLGITNSSNMIPGRFGPVGFVSSNSFYVATGLDSNPYSDVWRISLPRTSLSNTAPISPPQQAAPTMPALAPTSFTPIAQVPISAPSQAPLTSPPPIPAPTLAPIVGCPLQRPFVPQGSTLECNGTVWIIRGDINLSVGQVVVFNITSSGVPVITVDGCVSLGSAPALVRLDGPTVADLLQSSTNKSYVLVESTRSCLSGEFGNVQVECEDAERCRQSCVGGSQSATSTTLSVLLYSGCDSNNLITGGAEGVAWWIILLAVLGGVVLIASFVVLLAKFNPKVRSAIFPYLSRRTSPTTMEPLELEPQE